MNEATDKPSLLIVDDDPLISDTLSFTLGGDFVVATASSRPEAIARALAAPRPPALALVDLGLPPTPHRPDEGFSLIAELLARIPGIRIVVLSGQNDEANARHARALGAVDFVAKPASPEALRQALCSALAFPAGEAAAAAAPIGPELVGNSPAMQKLRLQLLQYADSPFPVLIDGESGSGKEIVAVSLHGNARRRESPFLALNCAAIAPTLVEPTLFGHAKGAFTGAAGARAGYFEEAGEGTLFLDEIGELPLDLQPKLLRVLENGAYQRVGETLERTSSARVVAATNRDLKKEVREGRFRADLYHRLSVFTISVPSLREMGDDRLLLLNHYRELIAGQAGQVPFRLSPEAETRWRDYHFPGNVRELRNIVIRLTTKHAGQILSREALEEELDVADAGPDAGRAPGQDVRTRMEIARDDLLGKGEGFRLDETLQGWESAYIEAAQHIAQGNISQAARLLGVNRSTLYSRMDNLSRPREKD